MAYRYFSNPNDLILDAAVGTARLSKITADLPDDPADRRAGKHAERTRAFHRVAF